MRDSPLKEYVCQWAADVLSHLVIRWGSHGRNWWMSGSGRWRVAVGNRGCWRWRHPGGWGRLALGAGILLLRRFLRNGEVGLGDSDCPRDMNRTRRKRWWQRGGRQGWLLGLCWSFSRGFCRFLGGLWAGGLKRRLLPLRGNLCWICWRLLFSFACCCRCWCRFLRSWWRLLLTLLYISGRSCKYKTRPSVLTFLISPLISRCDTQFGVIMLNDNHYTQLATTQVKSWSVCE